MITKFVAQTISKSILDKFDYLCNW